MSATATERSYIDHHYVPRWYQRRFLDPSAGEEKYFYLDLDPEVRAGGDGVPRPRKALNRWGTKSCFRQDHLYTVRLGSFMSTDIESRFFGDIDRVGQKGVEYFADFEHPSADGEAYHGLLAFMSVQRLRTPKGLAYLRDLTQFRDNNLVLNAMLRLQRMYCAVWTECVWSIVDASESPTKFIISDHPVTVYNRECFPLSKWCRGHSDPDILMNGTHTYFPLSLDKMLVLTNLSWVRNPYANALRYRPNPDLFRDAMFYFPGIQTGRKLTESEVCQINYITKRRAYRYVAAAKEEWLYPEKVLADDHWRKLGRGYLLMPDPRSCTFTSEIVAGYSDGRSVAFDEYGRRPDDREYRDEKLHNKEWHSFHRFQGEFARLFGPKRRGVTYEFSRVTTEDDPEHHAWVVAGEQRHGGPPIRRSRQSDSARIEPRRRRDK